MKIANIILGIFLILAGGYTIYFTNKNPDPQLTNTSFKGYAGGIGLIIGGFMLLLGMVSISDF